MSNSTRCRASKEPETWTILQFEIVETEVNPTQEVESGLACYGPKIT